MKIWISRILKSKTLMFNLLVAALASLEGVFSLLQPHIAGNVFAYITIALTVGNAILRAITTTSLRNK